MRKLTVKDVAREAGVSTATISRVLNNTGYVSDKARAHVLATIKRLNYRPNSIARSLKQEKTRSVGLILPDMTNPYFMTMARQIQRQCLDAGYHVLLMDSEEEANKEWNALQFMLEKRVEALVLAGTGHNQQLIESFERSGVYVLLIDRRIDGVNADVVEENNRQITCKAVEHLLQNGHRRVGIIQGPKHISTAQERHDGVRDAFAAAGLEIDPEYVYEGNYTRQSGLQAAHYLMSLAKRPTAIFSANNEMTFGLYLGMHELGINLEQVEVVSFGDLEFSPLFKHRLAVVKQNPHKIGEEAGKLIVSRLAGETLERTIVQHMPTFVKKY